MPWARTRLLTPKSGAQSRPAVSYRFECTWWVRKIVCGRVATTRPEASELPIVIVPAAEWITMDEKAANAIRKKPGSTMRVGLRLVKEKESPVS